MKILKSSDFMVRNIKRMMFLSVCLLWGGFAFAQDNDNSVNNNPYAKLGQKALMDGDFKAAVTHLEKALPSDPENETILYALGYSQYHSDDYKGAIISFTKVIVQQPDNVSAYYYRGKAQNTLALNPAGRDNQREKLLTASIDDYTKAIGLDDEDTKLYQNRALAYRDLGNLQGTKTSDNYDASIARDAYDKSIADLNHVLEKFPGRKDMSKELKKVKIYRSSVDE